MLQEFKKFIMKGNLVEIAVGLILALAFAAVVTSFVEDIITPIIAAIGGQPNFDDLVIDIGEGKIRYGQFLNAVISFVIIGFVLFLVVKAYNSVKDKMATSPEDEDVPDDIALLREIRDELRRRGTV